LQITLPTAAADKMQERPREMLVSVSGDGRYAVDRQPVDGRSVEELTAAIGKAADGRNDVIVIVSADALAAHQTVVNVLDAARRAGLSRLTFAAQAPAGAR
jgi:biopolymer transport protein ExbD